MCINNCTFKNPTKSGGEKIYIQVITLIQFETDTTPLPQSISPVNICNIILLHVYQLHIYSKYNVKKKKTKEKEK